MSGSTSDQVKSILGAGVKAILSKASVVQIGTQVLTNLRGPSKSASLERQALIRRNGSAKTSRSSNNIGSHVQDALHVVKSAIEIANALQNVYNFVKPSSSVNSNYKPCYSKRPDEARRNKESIESANSCASEAEEPVPQKQTNLRTPAKKETKSDKGPQCDICRAKSDVRQLGLSPCQHIFCYDCLIIVTDCTVCGKPFRRDDFWMIS